MKILAAHNNARLKVLLGEKYKKIYKREEFEKEKLKENIFEELKVNSLSEKKIISQFDNGIVNNSINIAKVEDIESLIKVLELKGIELIDNRIKGGFLWIIGGKELEGLLNLTNIKLNFLVKGGRTSKNRPAWYIK